MKKLRGKLIHAGNLSVNGEFYTGVSIEIDKGTLRRAESIPVYREVVILESWEYDKMTESKCQWSEDEDGNWETICGEVHCFVTDGPGDNRYQFCPYCGSRIVENGYKGGKL